MDSETIRKAQALPGFRWMPGMWYRFDSEGSEGLAYGDRATGHYGLSKESHSDLIEGRVYDDGADVTNPTLDPTDPATAGCLLALLGLPVHCSTGQSLGETCIRVALTRGRWGV